VNRLNGPFVKAAVSGCGYGEVVSSPRRRATLKDVAAATGLSSAAVSYALRGLHVPQETQARVRAAARDLGYEVNPVARALAGGRSGTVGVLCGSLEDLWQQTMAVSLSVALLAQGRYAIVTEASGDLHREARLVRELSERQVDGVIAFPLDPTSEHWADLASRTPVVAMGDALVGAPGSSSVVFDNAAGIGSGLRHLAGLGHRNVVLLTPSLPQTPGRPADRLARDHATILGLRLRLVACPASVAGTADVVAPLLADPDGPRAVFCLSDSMAYGVYLAAQRLGVVVPGDLSVLGYDDHQMSVLVAPPLTTFAWDADGIVGAAVDQLVRLMDTWDSDGGAAHAAVTFEPTLISRASTAAPRPGR